MNTFSKNLRLLFQPLTTEYVSRGVRKSEVNAHLHCALGQSGQYSVNAMMTLVILVSLKTMELLQNGGCNPFRNDSMVYMALLHCRTRTLIPTRTQEAFPYGYNCIIILSKFHIAQRWIQIPILTCQYRNGMGIRIRIYLRQCE